MTVKKIDADDCRRFTLNWLKAYPQESFLACQISEKIGAATQQVACACLTLAATGAIQRTTIRRGGHDAFLYRYGAPAEEPVPEAAAIPIPKPVTTCAPRKCLVCDRKFNPKTRYIFICGTCKKNKTTRDISYEAE